jgi:hypothetical protein
MLFIVDIMGNATDIGVTIIVITDMDTVVKTREVCIDEDAQNIKCH